MREKALTFGSTCKLVGILSEPGKDDVRPGAPGVLLLNSGILHRVGACRMHVRLARRLAAAGVSVLRFDFSGIGDSEPRKDALSFTESAPLEVEEAMDFLATRKGIERFAVLGLCSGADVGYFSALADDRIVALGQIDPWPYATPRSYLNHYGPKLGNAGSWKNFVSRQAGRVLGRGPEPEQPGPDVEMPKYIRETPRRDEVAAGFSALLSRGVRLLHIYSGGQEAYNYEEQVIDAFPEVDFGGQLSLHYIPEADHIFTGLEHQQRLLDTVADWVSAIDAPPA